MAMRREPIFSSSHRVTARTQQDNVLTGMGVEPGVWHIEQALRGSSAFMMRIFITVAEMLERIRIES